MQKNNNVVRLLKSINMWLMNQQETQYPTVLILLSLKALLSMHQNKYENLEDCRTRFKVVVQVLEHIGLDLEKALVKRVDEIFKEQNLTRE